MERFFKIVRLGIFLLSVYLFMTADWIYDVLESTMDTNTATMWGNFYVVFLFIGVIAAFTFLFWEKRNEN